MLKAKYNYIIYKFFTLYTILLIKIYFKEVKIIGRYEERYKPILLLSNHTSWWDGFWSMVLNIKIFKRKFHFLMLEEQLKRHIYFNYAGGYSIKKKSKDLIKSLKYTAELLKEKNNLVLFFPQGSIQSQYKNQIKFQSGLKKILENLENEITILFQVNLIEYLNQKKPTLYIYFQEYEGSNSTFHEIEKNYNIFLEKCLNEQKEICI